VGRGHLLLVALVVAWPLVAWLVVGIARPPVRGRWRPFAWTAAAATLVALVALIGMRVLFLRGGTTEAMAALGYQIFAGMCVLGAIVCGAIAIVLRKSSR
jgi:hypothetical protein